MEVPHPVGGNIDWSFVDDNIIKEKYYNKEIRLCGFDHTSFEENYYGVVR